MKTNRFWIEIVALGTASACALALVIACVGAAGVAIAGRPQSSPALATQAALGKAAESSPASSLTTVSRVREGMVTCSRCGAKHSARSAVRPPWTAALRACVAGLRRSVLVDGENIYPLDAPPHRLKKVAGQRSRIVGVAREIGSRCRRTRLPPKECGEERIRSGSRPPDRMPPCGCRPNRCYTSGRTPPAGDYEDGLVSVPVEADTPGPATAAGTGEGGTGTGTGWRE